MKVQEYVTGSKEDSIEIECNFINGTDAQGCKIVVVSGHSSVGNITAMLIRHNESDTTVSGQASTSPITLTATIMCWPLTLKLMVPSAVWPLEGK